MATTASSAKLVDEFIDVATIPDKQAFGARLVAVIEREVNARARVATPGAAFRAEERWQPNATEQQRGRALLLKEFAQPHMLTVPQFAALAGKSRQQLYRDIEQHRLLALSIGARGQRLPDWQLDKVKKNLTLALLQRAGDIDPWTLYYALARPSEALSGQAPIKAVGVTDSAKVLRVVLDQLGVQQ